MVHLKPIIHPSTKRLLDKPDLLFDLVNACGSPLNLVFPERLAENVLRFNKVLSEQNIHGQIYYAHKSNKSQAMLRQALKSGSGVDVASESELTAALKSGFTGHKIEATGPKNKSFLLLAMQHGCLISIDSLAELATLIELREKMALPAPTSVLIRLTGFVRSGIPILSRESRFGIPVSQLNTIYSMLLSHPESIALHGFSFHIDSTSLTEKAACLDGIFRAYQSAVDKGFEPQMLNIGGGFRLNYLEDGVAWEEWIATLQQVALGTKTGETWQNTSFGFYQEAGAVRGGTTFYDYFSDTSGPKFLEDILKSPSSVNPHVSLGQLLSEHMATIAIEPGRALLDQAGITLAKVIFTKESATGDLLIGLDMNRSNLASIDQEMMVDPVLLTTRDTATGEETEGYLVGNLCLESDFISRRKLSFSQKPTEGDLIAFLNTAPYNMDFNESFTAQQPVAPKICVIEKDGNFEWYQDNIYNPYLSGAI